MVEAGRELEPAACHWSPSSWPIHALHELAAYEHAELIVLGVAREDLGDRIHVSPMERMVHGAPCADARGALPGAGHTARRGGWRRSR